MKKNKSYMNNENILSEGFFNKLFSIFKVSTSDQKKIKNNQKMKNELKLLNKSLDNIEDHISQELGRDFTLKAGKFKLSDFF
tara:strand:- start:143 stop:388 length:246 start_codon:yes stop_codon:yes gene_type:complete